MTDYQLVAVSDAVTFDLGEPRPPSFVPCRVYWGSHGCDLPHGHDLTDGPDRYCRCNCADDEDAVPLAEGGSNVGAYPYYGPDTRFYGEDAAAVWGEDRVIR